MYSAMLSRRRMKFLPVFRLAELDALEFGIDIAKQAGEHAARAHFDESVHAGAGQLAGLTQPSAPDSAPAGTALRALPGQSVMTRACQLLTSGTARSRNSVASRSAAKRSCAGFINAQWNGALTGSSTARRAPAALASSIGPVHGARVAGDHDLVGRIEIGGAHHFALRGFCSERSPACPPAA